MEERKLCFWSFGCVHELVSGCEVHPTVDSPKVGCSLHPTLPVWGFSKTLRLLHMLGQPYLPTEGVIVKQSKKKVRDVLLTVAKIPKSQHDEEPEVVATLERFCLVSPRNH